MIDELFNMYEVIISKYRDRINLYKAQKEEQQQATPQESGNSKKMEH